MDASQKRDRTLLTQVAEEATDATRCGPVGEATQATTSAGVLGRIDRYVLLRELGGGGFGVVYLARDSVAGVEVAVKGLPPLVRKNQEELERIRENFALVCRLYHPHIAPALVLHQAQEVHYADEQVKGALRVFPGDYLMVMAFAPGMTLSAWRRRFPAGRVPVAQALEVCRQIASALDYAHGEKIIHRDVKPSNVVVETAAGDAVRCRVLDFGLAAEIHSSLSRVSTEVCDTSGTRPYMAPEQWQGKPQGPQTDQYALAAVFCELVGGRVPFASAFETGDVAIMVAAVMGERPDPLPQLTDAQNKVVFKGLAKDASKRFESCAAFVEALERAGADAAVASVGRQARSRLLWGAAAGLCAVALAFYVGLRTVPRSQQGRRDADASTPAARPPTISQPPPAAPAGAPAVSQEGASGAAKSGPSAVAPSPVAQAKPAVTAEVAAAVQPAAVKPAPTPAVTQTAAELKSVLPQTAPALSEDLLGELARKVEEKIPAGAPEPVRIGIGCLTSGEGVLMAAYSSVLREGLRRALASKPRFQVVGGERLTALMLRDGGLDRNLLTAGSETGPVRLEELDALLRGRFASYKGEVRVCAELVWLRSGEVATLQAVTPAARVMELLWPGADTAQTSTQLRLAEVMTPQNEAAGLKNIVEVESRARRLPHDFGVSLVTADARQDYAAGETCRYLFRSEIGCHLAVFCHQVDGSSVVLFPNRWSEDTWVPAGQVVQIPGEGKGGFEITISPPFGADVVQVVACTARSSLHQWVAEVSSRATPGLAFGVLSRGLQTADMDRGLSEASVRNGTVRWSEAHLVICTHPKLAGWN